MRNFTKTIVATLALTLPLALAACSDSDDNADNSGDGDGTGGIGDGDGDGDGTGGTGDGDGDGTGGTGDGDGDGDGTGGTGDGDGDGDNEPPFTPEDCEAEDGPAAAVLESGVGAFSDGAEWLEGWTNFSADSTPEDDGSAVTETLTGDLSTMTLDADEIYELDGEVYVPDGVTLTIPAGTLIKSSGKGTLIVSRGGKLVAEGTKDKPIVFTSQAANGSKSHGQWGGLVLLGKGKNFKGQDVDVEGLQAGNPASQYGGDDNDDSSGSLKFVRIEFGGVDLLDGNEINGLTLGSVGSETTIEHVQVSYNRDDGFEWFGGAVNAKYLVANSVGDDSFDMDQGYVGTVEYIFSRQIETVKSDPNGFEWDSDLGDRTPVTHPTVKHATICGIPDGKPNYGAVFRENIKATIDDVVFVGFDAGIDTRDGFTADNIKLTNALSWGHDIGAAMDESEACGEDEATQCDNDEGFDEAKWLANSQGSKDYQAE